MTTPGLFQSSPARAGVLMVPVMITLLLALAGLLLGPVSLSMERFIAVLTGEGDAMARAIILDIRLPRLLLGLSVGVALALSGAALQGLLRNPLADPGLIGVTGGAALGAVTMIVLGDALIPAQAQFLARYSLPLAAFAGSLLVITVLFRIARRTGETAVATLILAGVAINTLTGAAIGLLVYISDDQQLRDITFWTMGGLGMADWQLTPLVLLAVGLTLPVFRHHTRALDLLQLGESAAFHSGVHVERTKRTLALVAALSVGAVTALAGPIGFIGLVAPHLARMLVGPGHARLLPMSLLLGVALVLAADLAVRNLVPPAEPPIGLATSLIGGPFFLWLLMRRRSN